MSDTPGDETLYWINPITGLVIHECPVGLPDVRDICAAPRGGGATGI